MPLGKFARASSIGLIAATLVFALQFRSGAYVSDFSADEDEAAHAVSGLAVYDYLTQGFPHDPIAFGERYYVHYPKLAIGHWPPLFYAGEAVWMLVFGRTRAAMIAAVGVLAIALLLSIFFWVKRDCGTAAGAVAALAMLAPKFVQSAIGTMSPDLALALLCFWAAVFLGEYLDRGRMRDAVLSGLAAAAAVGVHGRGGALILLPCALLLVGNCTWTPLRVVALLASVAVVIVVPARLGQTWPFALRPALGLAVHYPLRLGATMSWPMLGLAAAGAFAVMRSPGQPSPGQPRHWRAMPALAISAWAFHSLANAGLADHYLISAAPAVAALSGRGFRFCADALPRTGWRVALGAAALAVLLWTALPLAKKRDLGFHRMAAGTGRISLIAGNPIQEGAFTAEMDLRDPDQSRFVVRGYKVLASADWTGHEYRLRFTTGEEVLAGLDRMRVDTVLLAQNSTLPHVVQLLAALRSPAWNATHPDGLPSGILAFQRAVPLPPGEPVIRFGTRNILGRRLDFSTR